MDNEEAVIPEAELTEEEAELGFYKTLVEIPYTDEHGNELGKTEIGSIQEVPVGLGDMWVENNMAEKVEKPQESLLNKVTAGLLGNK